MFCSSAQHGREKKRDIFVAETTRESRSPIQPAQKKTVKPDRYPQCPVVAPERSVWTLPRNNWWARNAGDTIDIGACPDAMFVSNLRMSKTTFMLLCEELGPFVWRSDTTFRRAISVQHRISTLAQMSIMAATSSFIQLTFIWVFVSLLPVDASAAEAILSSSELVTRLRSKLAIPECIAPVDRERGGVSV